MRDDGIRRDYAYRMKVSKPPVHTDVVLSLDFDESRGAVTIATSCRPGLNLGVALGYALTADEARQLATALTTWAADK